MIFVMSSVTMSFVWRSLPVTVIGLRPSPSSSLKPMKYGASSISPSSSSVPRRTMRPVTQASMRTSRILLKWLESDLSRWTFWSILSATARMFSLTFGA